MTTKHFDQQEMSSARALYLLKKIRKAYEPELIGQKVDLLNTGLSLKLQAIKPQSYDTTLWQGNIENPIGVAQIPIGLIGPLHIDGKNAQGQFYVPMATTEGALTLTYDVGARLLSLGNPIQTAVLANVIHITANFPIVDRSASASIHQLLAQDYETIRAVAQQGSRHTKLLDIEQHIVGTNHLLKFKFDTADAHGLNMINQATFQACTYISKKLGLDFFHRSHYSAVKHCSPLNQEQGYGRRVKASTIIQRRALEALSVSAVRLKDFFDRCIDCAGAAGVRSVNVHAANAIAAVYLACGQDMADLSSSHVCKSKVELLNNDQDLYWEIEIPNLLVATVGGGTGLPTQRECLEILGCSGSGKADKFAEIVAATALAGEFTTAAAVVNKTYIDVHNRYGRNGKENINRCRTQTHTRDAYSLKIFNCHESHLKYESGSV